MKDLRIITVGVIAVFTTLALNFRHAFNDYGVLDNKLHVEVLAQSNNSGGEFSFNGQGWHTHDNGLWNGNWFPKLTSCQHTTTSGFPPYQVSITYWGKMVVCESGTGNCINGTPCVADSAGGNT